MNQTQNKSGRLLLAWAVVATLVGITSTAVSVLLFAQLRSLKAVRVPIHTAPFAELREDAMVGRYKWIEEGKVPGVITLLPDHSFVPPKGGKTPAHQWEIGHDALLVVWLSGVDRFTRIESPGVYIATRPDGRVVRMEKEQL